MRLLDDHGLCLVAEDDDAEDAVLQLATGALTLEAFADWLEANSVRTDVDADA